MLKIVTLESKKGLYVSGGRFGYNGRRDGIAHGTYFINHPDVVVKDTHISGWKLLEGEFSIDKVLTKEQRKKVNIRWELIDKEDNEIGLPEVLSPQEVCEWWNDDDDVYDHCFGKKSKYHKYRTFYSRKFDYSEQQYKEVEFEVNNLGKILNEEVENYSSEKVKLVTPSYDNKNPHPVDLNSVTTYSELAQMLVPELAIHNQPCAISCDNTYRIIRNHILDNIDGKYARVTSNYDFCFTVKKIVYVKPYTYTTEEKKRNGRSYARPRIKTHTVNKKEEVIFEMCPSKKYQDYTPIEGFKGDSLQDLIDNMKNYLDELMKYINMPLEECSCCNGTGHIFTDFDKNKR